MAIVEADDYKVSGAWTFGMRDVVIIQSIVAARLCNTVLLEVGCPVLSRQTI